MTISEESKTFLVEFGKVIYYDIYLPNFNGDGEPIKYFHFNINDIIDATEDITEEKLVELREKAQIKTNKKLSL